MTFEFLLRFSEFYFLFSATPTGFLIFCLPADKATAKSVTKYSPTDSEKQTAVVCKDNGLFSLTKPVLCQKPSTLVKTPPVSVCVCVCVCLVCVCVFSVCVCVCVCISSKDMLFALFALFTLVYS